MSIELTLADRITWTLQQLFDDSIMAYRIFDLFCI